MTTLLFIALSFVGGVILGKVIAMAYIAYMANLKCQTYFRSVMVECVKKVLEHDGIHDDNLSYLRYMATNTGSWKQAALICFHALTHGSLGQLVWRVSNKGVPREAILYYIAAMIYAITATTFTVPGIGGLARKRLLSSAGSSSLEIDRGNG